MTLRIYYLDGARVASWQRSDISDQSRLIHVPAFFVEVHAVVGEVLLPGSLVARSEVLKQLLRATDKFVVRDAVLRLTGSQR